MRKIIFKKGGALALIALPLDPSLVIGGTTHQETPTSSVSSSSSDVIGGTTDQETPTSSVSSSSSGVIGGAVGGLVGALLFVTAAVVTVVGLVVACRRKKKYSGKMCNMSDATGY